MAGEYEALLAAAVSEYDFPDFDENAQATTFYTTGTTGNPKGVISATASWCCIPWVVPPRWAAPTARAHPPRRRVHADDADVPRPRLGLPYLATMLGVKQVYPGRYQPDVICRLISEERSASRIACRPSCTCC
jgi:fatty-acyl-CoA synthase